MVIPPDRPPDASHPPPSTTTQLKPTHASEACHQQPPHEILANENHTISTNNVIKRTPRQPRQYESRQYRAARNMAPLPPPPNNALVASLPPITDPQIDYPPGEWKRFSKKRKKKIRAEYRKAEKSAAAIVPLTSKNPAAAISDRMLRNPAPTIKIITGYLFDPDAPTASTKNLLIEKRYDMFKKVLLTLNPTPSGNYSPNAPETWLRYSISPRNNKKEHPPCSRNPRYQNLPSLPPVSPIAEIDEISNDEKTQEQPPLRAGCGIKIDCRALKLVLYGLTT